MLTAEVSLTFLLWVDLGVDNDGEEGGDSVPGGITQCETDCGFVLIQSAGTVEPEVGVTVVSNSSRNGSGYPEHKLWKH